MYRNLLFDSWCSAQGFLPILSKRLKPDMQNIQSWPFNLPFLLTDPLGFFQQNKGTEHETQKIPKCLFWKLDVFYSSILTSCIRHDVNNV